MSRKMNEYIYRELLDTDGNIVGREYGGKLIRCKFCKYNHETTWVDCELLPQMFGLLAIKNYCSLAEPKEDK